jgi:amino acid transporter
MRKLKLLPLAAIIFLTISGGPYGLESLLADVGNKWAIILLFITPVLWDLPTIFTVLELNSMMPVTGGYYQWVKRALGMRFAWFEGWWTWIYTFVDLAIYPVLFVEYLGFLFPEAHAWKIPICLVIVWAAAFINIRGIVPVGRTALILGCIVIVPFLVLGIYFLAGSTAVAPALAAAPEEIRFSALGVGLYTVMWNFLGWDNVTTYAEEVASPVKTYLRSVLLAFTVIFLVYLMVILIAMYSGISYSVLAEEGYPVLGELLGGKFLGTLIAVGGMAGALGLYASVLLSVSRVPKVMSDDKLLPEIVHKEHPKFKTPYVSIICCSLVVSCLIVLPFAELLVMDVMIYGAALFLEFAALIVFRIKLPDIERPFRIRLGTPGLIAMICFPVMIYGIALAGTVMSEGSSLWPVLLALGVLASAELFWRIMCWRNPELKTQKGLLGKEKA